MEGANLKRIIFLIDMNSFFVSCELIRSPQYKKKPIVIASRSKRSVILAASYAAKKLGIDSAMNLQTALMKFPQIEIIPPDMEYYISYSKKIMQFLKQFSQHIASASVDEAYVDVTHYFEKTPSTPENVRKLASFIQAKLLKELGLPSNIGISTTRFLAKMASELRKPFVIESIYIDEIEQKLWPLPIGMMYGIGKKSTALLEYIHIKTIGEFAIFENEILLERLLGKHILEQQQYARGIFIQSQSVVKQREEALSISQSRTFLEDVTEYITLEKKLSDLWGNIVDEVKRKNHKVRCIKVFYKQEDFHTMQRSQTMPDYSDDFDAIYKDALALFLMLWDGEPIRLVGIGVSDFIEKQRHAEQLNLFQMNTAELARKVQKEKVHSALSLLPRKYGLMTGKDLLEKRNNDGNSNGKKTNK